MNELTKFLEIQKIIILQGKEIKTKINKLKVFRILDATLQIIDYGEKVIISTEHLLVYNDGNDIIYIKGNHYILINLLNRIKNYYIDKDKINNNTNILQKEILKMLLKDINSGIKNIEFNNNSKWENNNDTIINEIEKQIGLLLLSKI